MNQRELERRIAEHAARREQEQREAEEAPHQPARPNAGRQRRGPGPHGGRCG
jgi:hypothetical protein